MSGFVYIGPPTGAEQDFERRLEQLSALALPWTAAAILDGGVTDFTPWVVTERAGLPVALPDGWEGIKAALDCALNVAGALTDAHEKGVYHGDISLAALSLSDAGELQIARLGLLSLFRVPLDASERRACAPEVVELGYPTGPQADVYGIAAMVDRAVRDRLLPGSALPPELREVSARGMAVDPAARATLEELFDLLRDAAAAVCAIQAGRDTLRGEDPGGDEQRGPATPRSPETRDTLPASIEISAPRPAPPRPELPAARAAAGPLAFVALVLAVLALGAVVALAVLHRPAPVVVQVPPAPASPPALPAPAPQPREAPPAAAPMPPGSPQHTVPSRAARLPGNVRVCDTDDWYSCSAPRR
ncbi:hypothetical protein WME77_20140 [Sorangium sp. So ce764]|uniref:hypothetical protein n=1 Tax=Sorangium sp. So ce764 TaxID=3133320 RepID=UPI003F601E59